MDANKAERAVRNGALAGVFSAVITLAVIGVQAGSAQTGKVPVLGWEALVDVVLISLLSFGIRQRSVLAAALMLVYFGASKLLLVQELGPRAFGGVVLFGYLYLRALQGAVALREPGTGKASGPRVPWWAYYTVPSALFTLAFALWQR